MAAELSLYQMFLMYLTIKSQLKRFIGFSGLIISLSLLCSCGDPSVNYCEDLNSINTAYGEESNELVERLLKLKKSPSLPALADCAEDAATLLANRNYEIKELNTEGVDAALINFVNKDLALYGNIQSTAEYYRDYFNDLLSGKNKQFDVSRAQGVFLSGRNKVRKLLADAQALDREATVIQAEVSEKLNTPLPNISFPIPDIKPLLKMN